MAQIIMRFLPNGDVEIKGKGMGPECLDKLRPFHEAFGIKPGEGEITPEFLNQDEEGTITA